jgi:hypothetical protein
MSLLSCLDFLGGCILESDSSSNFLLVEDSEFLLTLEALSGLLLVLDSESLLTLEAFSGLLLVLDSESAESESGKLVL